MLYSNVYVCQSTISFRLQRRFLQSALRSLHSCLSRRTVQYIPNMLPSFSMQTIASFYQRQILGHTQSQFISPQLSQLLMNVQPQKHLLQNPRQKPIGALTMQHQCDVSVHTQPNSPNSPKFTIQHSSKVAALNRLWILISIYYVVLGCHFNSLSLCRFFSSGTAFFDVMVNSRLDSSEDLLC